MHEGHRGRIIERLARDEKALQDHELLEILLFNAIPRKNTNEIAHRLIKTFGGLEGVFSAEVEELARVEGVGKSTAAYLRTLSLCYERIRKREVSDSQKMNVSRFAEMLAPRYAGAIQEELELFALDSNDQIKASKCYTNGSKSAVIVPSEEIVRFLANNRPYALVAVHNHVTSDCTPSRADDEFTAMVAVICSLHRVKFVDHMIFSRKGYYSYFGSSRIDGICNRFNFTALTAEILI